MRSAFRAEVTYRSPRFLFYGNACFAEQNCYNPMYMNKGVQANSYMFIINILCTSDRRLIFAL